MLNTDMHVIEFLEDGKYNVTDRYSLGYIEPKLDTSLNGTDDIYNITYKNDPLSPDDPIITYYRKIKTLDKYDYQFTPETKVPLIQAWGKGLIAYHGGNRNISTFLLSTNMDNVEKGSSFNFFDFHGITLSVTWMGFAFIGYVSIRFYKHTKGGVLVHVLSAGFNGLYTFVLSIVTITKCMLLYSIYYSSLRNLFEFTLIYLNLFEFLP